MLRAAVDIETTGVTPGIHEIVQISILVFNKNFEPFNRFVSYVKPLKPEYAMPEAMAVNGLSLKDLKKAPNPAQVRNLFINWKHSHFEDERIKILGQNAGQFDVQFLKLFLSNDIHDSIFNRRVDDTQTVAQFLKDNGSLPEDLNTDFQSLKNYFKIEGKSHDAYSDTVMTLELYKKMVQLSKGEVL